jgi:hypothetical protein
MRPGSPAHLGPSPRLGVGLARLVAFAALAGPVAPAAAGELTLGGSGSAGASSATGEGVLATTARVGFRFDGVFELELFGRAGWADGPSPEATPLTSANANGAEFPPEGARVLGALGAGVRFYRPLSRRVHPYARAALLAQNERDPARAAGDVLGSLLGTARDIERRIGVLGAVGLDLELVRGRSAALSLVLDAEAARLGGAGPRWYVQGAIGLGVAIDARAIAERL